MQGERTDGWILVSSGSINYLDFSGQVSEGIETDHDVVSVCSKPMKSGRNQSLTFLRSWTKHDNRLFSHTTIFYIQLQKASTISILAVTSKDGLKLSMTLLYSYEIRKETQKNQPFIFLWS